MNQFSQKRPAGQHSQQQIMAIDDDFIDLGQLFRAVMRYKWGILGLSFVITLVAGLIVFSMDPVYRATASVLLESQEANVVSVEKIYSVSSSDYGYAQTQYEILKSRNLAERVVRRLQLHKHPHFLPKEDEKEDSWYVFDLTSLLPAKKKAPPVQLSAEEREEQTIQSITGALAASLSVSPVEYSSVIYLSYESIDRALSALIVNTLAEEYIAGDLETRLSGTLQATDWLSERLEGLKKNLRDSEQALQDFRDREGLVDVDGVTGLGSSELQAFSQRLEDARKARIEAENIKKDLHGLTNASIEEWMTFPAVLRHQLIRDLKREQSAAERNVADLAKRYGRLHPKMISAQSDLATANSELAREVRKVVSGISREYEIALRTEEQLQTTWENRKAEMQEFNRKEFQLQELQREVDTNRQLYDIFFTRIRSVSETGGFEKPHARIVDRAMKPASPVKPNKKRSILLAFTIGTILGCGIAILLDVLDNAIKSPDDVQDKLGVPLLGTLPKMKLDKDGEFEQFWQKPQGQYAEAIRTVRTGIVLSSLDDPVKTIVVTSTVPGEGKSTTVLNLGAALAQMENTLVIGADLRRPSLAKRCRLAPNHPGLSHFVAGTAELDDCIEHLEDSKMFVMPAGVIPPNPLEMISSRRFVDALELLKDRFDRVILDSAPVQAVSDALVLASYADSVIFVVKADDTSAIHAKKSIGSIVASNEPLTGVVLNQFDVKRARSYYGSDYYQYGDYYQAQETTV